MLVLLVDLFEVEICQVHVTVRQYVHGENVFPFAETNLEKVRSQIPGVPLRPGRDGDPVLLQRLVPLPVKGASACRKLQDRSPLMSIVDRKTKSSQSSSTLGRFAT